MWDDILYGDEGNDTVYGFEGDDLISGGPGVDKLFGGPGEDVIWTAIPGGALGDRSINNPDGTPTP